MIFPDHVYSPSDVTDIPLSPSVEQAGIAAKDVDSANGELIEPVGLVLPATILDLGSDHKIGSSSASTNPLTKSPPKQNAFASEAAPVQLPIGITSISPLPKLVQSEGRKRCSASKSTILTSSPHKRSLRTLAKENATSKPKGKKVARRKSQSSLWLLQIKVLFFTIALCVESLMMRTGFSVCGAKIALMKHVPIFPMKNTIIVTVVSSFQCYCRLFLLFQQLRWPSGMERLSLEM